MRTVSTLSLSPFISISLSLSLWQSFHLYQLNTFRCNRRSGSLVSFDIVVTIVIVDVGVDVVAIQKRIPRLSSNIDSIMTILIHAQLYKYKYISI